MSNLTRETGGYREVIGTGWCGHRRFVIARDEAEAFRKLYSHPVDAERYQRYVGGRGLEL